MRRARPARVARIPSTASLFGERRRHQPLRQPFAPGDPLPFWVGHRHVDAHHLYDLDVDPSEDEDLVGTRTETEMLDVDVRVMALGGGRVRIWGQVLPPSERSEKGTLPADVVLTHPSYDFVSRPTNALGEFTFESVPEDDYTLIVATGDERLLVERLPARAGRT